MGHAIGKRAVTIGASMGGLLASRVLADHYGEVVVIERDAFPEPGVGRRGVPQGRHAHALLAAGREALERLFPGLCEELVALGAVRADIGKVRWFDNHDYHARCTGIEALLVSRPLLEAHVRSRLIALPNVRVMEQHEASRPATENGHRRVSGLTVTDRRSRDTDELRSDLVVDAAGRASRAPAWLEHWGLAKPREDVVRISLAYSSRIYRRRPEHLGGDVAAIIVPTPPDRRGGALLAMEGDRWMLTLMGLLGDHPPRDPDGFVEFAAGLRAPDIHEVISDAEALTAPTPFEFPASVRRRYEHIESFPEGYLVFGDAMCSFNPIYGQGMSVAALQAGALDAVLRTGSRDLARRFFQRAARALETPWRISVGGDLRYADVPGRRTPAVRFVNWYLARLHRAAHRDHHVAYSFQRVSNLLANARSILAPATVARVALGNLRGAASDRSRVSSNAT